MGACFHSAYTVEQVEEVKDFEYLISTDVDFYKEMLVSAKNDKLEKDYSKKEKKINFISLVINQLQIIIQKVKKYNTKKETPEKLKFLKENYQKAMNSINLIDENKFMDYINQIFPILDE